MFCSKEDVIIALTKSMNISNAKGVATVIANVLSDYEREMIIKSIAGIQPVAKYKVGDKLWAKMNSLYTWRFNIENCREKGIVFKDCLEVTIESIDLYKLAMYKVKYLCYKDDGSDITEEIDIGEVAFLEPEEYPEPDWTN